MDLREYLQQRGLTLDPTSIDKEFILTDEKLLEELALMWEEHQNAIKALLQSRVNSIAIRILNSNNIGIEGTIKQDALVEIGAIIQDFQKYSAELARRKKGEENGNKDNTTKEPPVIPEGEEGSL